MTPYAVAVHEKTLVTTALFEGVRRRRLVACWRVIEPILHGPSVIRSRKPFGRMLKAKKMADFVRERLVDIQFGRKPDLDKYLDGNGRKREVTPDLAEPPRRDPFNHHGAMAAAYGAHTMGGMGHLGGYATGIAALLTMRKGWLKL